MLIGLILFSVLLAAGAQLTLKHGMNQVADNTGALKLIVDVHQGRRIDAGGLGRPVPVRAVRDRLARACSRARRSRSPTRSRRSRTC